MCCVNRELVVAWRQHTDCEHSSRGLPHGAQLTHGKQARITTALLEAKEKNFFSNALTQVSYWIKSRKKLNYLTFLKNNLASAEGAHLEF